MSTTVSDPLANKKAACLTYVEQTKLLVTLASAFLLAPPSLVVLLKDRAAAGLGELSLPLLLATETLFVASVISGYVVMGTIAGSQDDGSYNVYRLATRISSLIQLACYAVGLILFVLVVRQALSLA